jgi:hypothetical protein
VEWLKTMSINEVLLQRDVCERIDRIRSDQAQFKALLTRKSFQLTNVVVTDLREVEHLPHVRGRADVALRRRRPPRRRHMRPAAGSRRRCDR